MLRLCDWFMTTSEFCIELQNADYTVAIKCITKKNLAKSQNLLSKEIKILQVFSCS